MPTIKINTNQNPAFVAIPDAAATDADLTVFYVDGAQQHANHGPFWKPGTTLVNLMRWEAWAMGNPWTPGGYIVSDGYGGSHALLWDGLQGNISFIDGGSAQHVVDYGSGSYFPPAGVFSHVAVTIEPDQYGNSYICTYMNGILVGQTLIPAGYTRYASNLGGEGVLFVGGSDHSNYIGWIAWLRAWETKCNIGGGNSIPGYAFVPERQFLNYDNANNVPDLHVNYVARPKTTFYVDASQGYNSQGGYAIRSQHPGTAYHILGVIGITNTGYPIPVPATVDNPITVAPFYPTYEDTPPDRGLTPATPPVSVKIFDSFGRPDQTYAHSTTPNVGTVEYSSVGAQSPWLGILPLSIPNPATPSKLQLFQGTLRLGERSPVFAYAGNSNSGDMDVRVTRELVSSTDQGNIGLGGRMSATFSGPVLTGFTGITVQWQYVPGVDSGTIYVYRWDAANNRTIIGSVGLAYTTAWSTLRAVFSGTSIDVYTDATLRLSLAGITQYQTQLGTGVWFHMDSTALAATSFSVY